MLMSAVILPLRPMSGAEVLQPPASVLMSMANVTTEKNREASLSVIRMTADTQLRKRDLEGLCDSSRHNPSSTPSLQMQQSKKEARK